MSLAIHWRILVGAVLAVMVAAFVLPPLAPKPDLRENRKLAPLPAPPASFGGLKAYREGLDTYVADHFPARAQLIAIFNYVRLPFGVSGSPRVIVGKQGWLFYDDGSHFGAARGDPAIPEADTRAWLGGLAGRTEALKAKGVPYIVLAAPLKETVYPQYAPDWFAGPNPDRPSMALTALADRSGLGQAMHFGPAVSHAARSGVKTFSTYDTHWSGAGAYAAYVALLQRLQRLGVVDEPPRPMSDFSPVDRDPLRDLAQMLGVGHFLRLEDVVLADRRTKARIVYLTPKEDWTAPHVIETGEVGKPTLLITVDSFSNALMPFLYSHFSRIVVAHNQDGTWREDLMERFQPDVVMLEVLESGLRFSLQPAPEPSVAAAARIDRLLADPNASQVALSRGKAVAVPPEDAILRTLAKAEPAPGCNIEVAALTSVGEQGPRLKLEGWISHLGQRPAPTIGLVRLTGSAGAYVAPMRTDRPRPDVEARFSNPMARLSGFSEEVALADLPAGGYGVAVYRRVRTRWIYCRAPQPIVIE